MFQQTKLLSSQVLMGIQGANSFAQVGESWSEV